MKRTSFLLRVTAALLTLFLLCPAFFSCASASDATTVDADTVVGEVGGVEILYDELYFLMRSFAPALVEKHRDNPAALAEALDTLARDELRANAAILLLCEDRGLKYKPSRLSDEVDSVLDTMLQQDFGGDEAAYTASLKELGLTERYLRYTTGLDLLYSDLLSVYPEEGLVITDGVALRSYVMENFVHVYHIALFNDTDDEAAANAEKLADARRMLVSGRVTMYDLLHGSKGSGANKLDLSGYNEDISDISGDGYYLTRGSWDKAYEDAAFSLKIGEVSEVVLGTGESSRTGNTVPTYYVIQRAEMDEDYVNTHLSELQDEYYASVIYEDLTEKRNTLRFEPNEFYESLDLANLLPSEEQADFTLVIVLGSIGAVLLIGAVGATVILRAKKRKK